ncbi:leucyl/phenylalanyl-tRNA--protein transferase [Viridibacterium curvum]|uniref:Leucyl/phenylalanyl-tRNA--protein transferase n=1 Tax=Viridibacterium curvum TaxID=1101404 RepID=A0ABP9QK25_9RHOO
MIPWLDPDAPPAFPPVSTALREPGGLLAAGGALTPEWLLTAYRSGIFPWYSVGDPILWWSLDPRMVLVPGQMRLTRSLLKTLRNGRFEVRCDTAFARVMKECAAPREPGGGTWITREMQRAYCRLHELGWAHSIECWQGDELVGGLYGLAIGRVFYGESMFHRVTDASKVAFAHLVRLLEQWNFAVIDCQMSTSHLHSLGAREISRADFVSGLTEWTAGDLTPANWADVDMAMDWSDQRPVSAPEHNAPAETT